MLANGFFRLRIFKQVIRKKDTIPESDLQRAAENPPKQSGCAQADEAVEDSQQA